MMRRSGQRLALLVVVLLAMFVPTLARAHEVRPAFLEIVEQEAGEWRITWKQPVMGDKALRLEPRLSNGWLTRDPAAEELTGSHYLRRWNVAGGASELEGSTLSIAGLDRTITDVVVRVERANGDTSETILARGDPEMRIRLEGAGGLAVPAYLSLGVHHILSGVDHLLFVFGLLLLVGTGWRLVAAITSFTLAHSMTLAASAMGLVKAPVAIIEALIAWSIVYVAYELTRAEGSADRLAARFPWIAAFSFGLLHGFGFAGALAETGLPDEDIPLALLLFNAGVEVGQLLFVGALLLLALGWRKLARGRQQPVEHYFTRWLAPYAMGCYAAFLFVERTVAAFA